MASREPHDGPGDGSLSGPAVSSASEPPPALLKALRRLLTPLVRLLLANRITHPYFANLLKGVYVEIAATEFGIEGRPQTTSRLSLLTGIHRKDVKRLREAPPDLLATPRTVSLGAQLVARWAGLDAYRDGDKPAPLPRLASSEGGASFESLVESVSKDIRPRAILDEWLRLGVVHIDDRDRVCLNTGAFVPEKGFDEKAYYLGRNLHDHISVAARNLIGDEPALIERSAYCDELTETAVEELAALARRLGEETLQQVNRRALELQARDAGRPEASRRMSFGMYFLEDADPAAAERTETPAAESEEPEEPER